MAITFKWKLTSEYIKYHMESKKYSHCSKGRNIKYLAIAKMPNFIKYFINS